jgi:hypothetical protein
VTTFVEAPFAVEPQTFVERPAEPQPATTFWYYCSDPAGYFPWVPTCNRPWTPVTPNAPPNAAPAG